MAHLRSSLHQNENVKTIVVRWKWKLYRVHKLHKFYWQHEKHFCLYRNSTVKYAVFALYFAPCLRRYNSRTTSLRKYHKTFLTTLYNVLLINIKYLLMTLSTSELNQLYPIKHMQLNLQHVGNKRIVISKN